MPLISQNFVGCVVQLPGDSLASVDVSLSMLEIFGTDTQTYSGVCRVTSALKTYGL